MRKYVEFEKMTIAKYNRGLINFEQAESYLYGYLKCLIDMQELDKERLDEEFTISVNKLLNAKQYNILRYENESNDDCL